MCSTRAFLRSFNATVCATYLIISEPFQSYQYISCIIPAGIRLPDKLTQELPVEWLPTEMYEKAAVLVSQSYAIASMGCEFHEISSQPNTDLLFAVLTNYGLVNYKKINKKLIERFFDCCDGVRPKGVKSWEQLTAITGMQCDTRWFDLI